MHLIDIRSFPALKLQEFVGNEIPKYYAILSHRWGQTQEEISFQEMLHPKAVTTDAEKKRWWKIQSFCQQASHDGFEWAWVDTCCINKDSSAELSEAINSMFQWYRQATKCYVYLTDISGIEQLPRSEWFQRGWTLQELLAPRNIQFFSHNWSKLGDKNTLLGTLAAITRIPENVLDGRKEIWRCPIAQRMSWASRRQTKRSEDMAYCLMGIFDVNMPLLYGEGGVKAFLRLQEEIIKVSADGTIFAWTNPQPSPYDPYDVYSNGTIYTLHGLLAESVDCFADSHDIFLARPMYFTEHEPYTVTNLGLRITFPVVEDDENMPFTSLAYIYCGRHTPDTKPGVENLGIYLARLHSIFYRINTNCLPVIETDWTSEPWETCTIYVPQRDQYRYREEWRSMVSGR